jgi:hypothetical protein
MDQMDEEERQSAGGQHSLLFIGTIYQQEHAGGSSSVDRPGPRSTCH